MVQLGLILPRDKSNDGYRTPRTRGHQDAKSDQIQDSGHVMGDRSTSLADMNSLIINIVQQTKERE